MCFQTTGPPSNFDESSRFFLLKNFLKAEGERSGIRTIVFNPFSYTYTYIWEREEERE